jgi:uncharacterized protein
LTRIGLLSDTHSFLDENIFEHFKNCDEIWHAGDFGQNAIPETIVNYFENTLHKKIIFRGVYGNIDDASIRNVYPEKLFFTCESVLVYMIHIGGYPGRYSKGVKDEIIKSKSKIFISGHSHILKIMYDNKIGCLHMNAGAAGKQGWHKVRTIIRFVIDGADIKDCEVIELT